MPALPFANGVPERRQYERLPQETNAYLVGGGVASLSAAAYLIRDAHVPGSQIHILEASALSGGSMDGAGSPDTGYILRGGRMLHFSYLCLYDLLSSIPSLSRTELTVMDEINKFNAVKENKTHSEARLVTRQSEYPGVKLGLADATDFELSRRDRITLLELTAQREHTLGRKEIRELFSPEFFETNFWFIFATT